MKQDELIYTYLKNEPFLRDTSRFSYQEDDVYKLYDFFCHDKNLFCHALYYTYLLHYKNDAIKNLLSSHEEDYLWNYFLKNKTFGYFVVASYLEIFLLRYHPVKVEQYLAYYDEAIGEEKRKFLLQEGIYQVYENALEHYHDSFQAFNCVQNLILNHTDQLVSLPKVGLDLDTFCSMEDTLISLLYEDTLQVIQKENLVHNAFYKELYVYLSEHQSDLTLPSNPSYLWQMLSIFIHHLEQQDYKSKKHLFFIEN